jgi:hypothetical protein
MSNVSGSISVNVEFRDTTTSSGVQSLKTIALRDGTEYTSGKVAIVTGTAGTAEVAINVAPQSPYKNASGEIVSFTSVLRYAFSATGSRAACVDNNGASVFSSGGRVSVSDTGVADDPFAISTTAGTCSYTLVLYGT